MQLRMKRNNNTFWQIPRTYIGLYDRLTESVFVRKGGVSPRLWKRHGVSQHNY